MTSATARDEPDGYELRVGRHLDDRWADWFGDLAMTREPDGTTTLRGAVADQAALHGILIKIRDLGMVLLAVRPIDVAPSTSTAPQPQPTPTDTTDRGL